MLGVPQPAGDERDEPAPLTGHPVVLQEKYLRAQND